MNSVVDRDLGLSPNPAPRGALRAIPQLRPLYMLPVDPFHDQVLLPAFRNADEVQCMMGFFRSNVLATLAPGLATFIAQTSNAFRLVISPHLSADDIAAIQSGITRPHEAAASALEDFLLTEDTLQRHTLECLAWLLRHDRMEIRIALMPGALFHPKVWIFRDGDDVLVAHGSSNLTSMGVRHNVEQVAVSRSWKSPDQHYIASKLTAQFHSLWDDQEDHCEVLPMPEAIRQRIIKIYHTECPPAEEDCRRHLGAAAFGREVREIHCPPPQEPVFQIPSNLRYTEGPYAHQGKAVDAWCSAGYRGILEMATGSGKTIAALICAHRLYQKEKPLFIAAAAPYAPLLDQWCKEMKSFGLRPVHLAAVGGRSNRGRTLRRIAGRLRSGLSDVESVVVSHDTLSTPEFNQAMQGFTGTQTLLIADESHNLGRRSFIAKPPLIFAYRLGLSATPTRQYDSEGTAKLTAYLGSVVFRFPLAEAIGNCLVSYDYHLHPAHLRDLEMDRWYELTELIRQNSWRTKEGDSKEYLEHLLLDRRRLLECAEAKLDKLYDLLMAEDTAELRYTLIYTSDKSPKQMTAVNAMLSELGLLFHPLTAAETADRRKMRRIIQAFQNGHIQILTAKRVLDEGVNIPQISKAFILASTTVERQWTQRRGRLLRKSPATGKDHSVIHDFVALPDREGLSGGAADRALISSELRRVQEFASLARNAGRSDGPLNFLHRMATVAYLDGREGV